MSTCRAFVVTAREEFGIAAVEAQAAGRPVIARRDGGVLETVVEGVTGQFWEGGSAELAAAIRSFDSGAVDSRACVENAERFGTEVFRRELPREVALALERSAEDHGGERRERRAARRKAVAERRGRTTHPRS